MKKLLIPLEPGQTFCIGTATATAFFNRADNGKTLISEIFSYQNDEFSIWDPSILVNDLFRRHIVISLPIK